MPMTMDRTIVRIGPFKDFIASGVRAGNVVTLSGQVSVDAGGQVVGEGDLSAQIRQAYANVAEVLGAFGITMDHVIDGGEGAEARFRRLHPDPPPGRALQHQPLKGDVLAADR